MLDRITLAPLMIPGRSMSRYHKKIGYYEICFSSEYIQNKYNFTDFSKVITYLDHKEKPSSSKTVSSFLKSENFSQQLSEELSKFAYGTELLKAFEGAYRNFNDLPVGTWFVINEFDDPLALQKFIDSGRTGMSVELSYTLTINGKKITIDDKFNRMDSPSDKLPYTLHIYGGCTFSYGRNEHGEAHFTVKKNGKTIDKIAIPKSSIWSSTELKDRGQLLTSENGNISRKDLKKIAEWLNDNWERCKNQWNEMNKDNLNRAIILL